MRHDEEWPRSRLVYTCNPSLTRTPLNDKRFISSLFLFLFDFYIFTGSLCHFLVIFIPALPYRAIYFYPSPFIHYAFSNKSGHLEEKVISLVFMLINKMSLFQSSIISWPTVMKIPLNFTTTNLWIDLRYIFRLHHDLYLQTQWVQSLLAELGVWVADCGSRDCSPWKDSGTEWWCLDTYPQGGSCPALGIHYRNNWNDNMR